MAVPIRPPTWRSSRRPPLDWRRWTGRYAGGRLYLKRLTRVGDDTDDALFAADLVRFRRRFATLYLIPPKGLCQARACAT